ASDAASVRAHRKGSSAAGCSSRSGSPGLQVTPENVNAVVEIIWNQISRLTQKGHIPAVGADGRRRRGTVAARAVRANADQLYRPTLQIADVDVVNAVRLAGHKITRVAYKGNEAPIPAHGWIAGETVCCAGAAAVHTDEHVCSRLQIADENVLVSVPVVRHNIVRQARESDESPVRAE